MLYKIELQDQKKYVTSAKCNTTVNVFHFCGTLLVFYPYLAKHVIMLPRY